ncbi:MAG: hypothetical protein QXS54_07630 [Candidatus Methanomethylicaceae archaeon]
MVTNILLAIILLLSAFQALTLLAILGGLNRLIHIISGLITASLAWVSDGGGRDAESEHVH